MTSQEHRIETETLISMKQGHLLRPERPPSRSTVDQWIRNGLVVPIHPDKPRVFLESIQIDGRIYTSVEAYQRMQERIRALRNEAICMRIDKIRKERA